MSEIPGLARAQAAYDAQEPPTTEDPPERCEACGEPIINDRCRCEWIDAEIDRQRERRLFGE